MVGLATRLASILARALAFATAFELFQPPKYLGVSPSLRERLGGTRAGRRLGRRPLLGRVGTPTVPVWQGGLSVRGSRRGCGSTAGRWHSGVLRRCSGTGDSSRHRRAEPISGAVAGGPIPRTRVGQSRRCSFCVRALGVHMKSGTRFMGSAQFPTTWRLVALRAKRHRVG